MSECEIANQEHAVELWRLLTIRPRSLAMRCLPSLIFPGALVVPNLKGLLDLRCSPAQPSTAIHFHKVHAAIMDTEAGAEEAVRLNGISTEENVLPGSSGFRRKERAEKLRKVMELY